MNGIKFNPKKLQFKSSKWEFFGHTLTPEGMKIDDRKVEAIKQMSAPKDKKGLQSFQGMINYLKRYSVKLMKLSEPLKPLLREDVEWTWDSTHQDAFDAIKEELTKTPVLAYFNPKSEHIIQTDASLKGLGAVLLQEGRPVIYVSRTLTPAEEHYSNLERELLGVVFAMERLHNYVYGVNKLACLTNCLYLLVIRGQKLEEGHNGTTMVAMAICKRNGQHEQRDKPEGPLSNSRTLNFEQESQYLKYLGSRKVRKIEEVSLYKN